MKLDGTNLGQTKEGQIDQKLVNLVPSQNGIMKLEGTDLGQIQEGHIMYRDFATVSAKIVARDKELELWMKKSMFFLRESRDDWDLPIVVKNPGNGTSYGEVRIRQLMEICLWLVWVNLYVRQV